MLYYIILVYYNYCIFNCMTIEFSTQASTQYFVCDVYIPSLTVRVTAFEDNNCVNRNHTIIYAHIVFDNVRK